MVRTVLEMELVPMGSWGMNLWGMLKASQWKKCQRWAREMYDDKCAVCGGVGKQWSTDTHKIWEYDEESTVQRLVGLIALCPNCHGFVHFGRSSARGFGDEVRAHAMRVNGWTDEECDAHIAAKYREWGARSGKLWTLDLTWLERELGIRVPARSSSAGDGASPAWVLSQI